MVTADLDNCELLGIDGILVQVLIGSLSFMSLFGSLTSQKNPRKTEAEDVHFLPGCGKTTNHERFASHFQRCAVCDSNAVARRVQR